MPLHKRSLTFARKEGRIKAAHVRHKHTRRHAYEACRKYVVGGIQQEDRAPASEREYSLIEALLL